MNEWRPDLFAYLDYPRNYLRKYLEDKSASSKMVYRMKKKQQRLDVIAYLAKVTAEQAAKEKPAAKKE